MSFVSIFLSENDNQSFKLEHREQKPECIPHNHNHVQVYIQFRMFMVMIIVEMI